MFYREIKDFSLAARTADASTPLWSPLLDPFSVECLLSASTSRLDEEAREEAPSGEARFTLAVNRGEAEVAVVAAAEVLLAARSVSGAIGVRGSIVGESL